MRGRTEILVETGRLLIVARRDVSGRLRAWCGGCDGEVEMLPTREAVALSTLSEGDLRHRIDDGLLHSAEGVMGRLYICRTSLGQTPGQTTASPV